jgi:hypothetical protein
MSCPHSLIGDPSFCSQCRGATPRKITYDESGRMLLDGVLVGPRAMVSVSRSAYGKRGARSSHGRTRNVDARNLDELDEVGD